MSTIHIPLHPTPALPLRKIYIWRCTASACGFVNSTTGSEEGKFRTLATGEILREPCFYYELCAFCREAAGRESCLLEVKLLRREDDVYSEGGEGDGRMAKRVKVMERRGGGEERRDH